MEEISLIIEAQEGNRLSLNMLFEDNYKILYGFLLKLTGDVELAKDLSQDTMVKAVIHLKNFKGNSKFSTWLIQIAINTYKNHIKKSKHSIVPLYENLVGSSSVEDDVIMKDQLERINKYLNRIKPIDRLIFVLKYYEGYSYEDIARMTGVKKGTCKSKMHYLIEKINKEVEVGR